MGRVATTLRLQWQAYTHHFLPGVALAYVLYAGVGGAAWKIFLLMLVYGLLYRASVVWAARSFELGREEIRRRLV